jgi:LAS superfamily LD-carboxypeptidase LdcB
MSKTKNRQIFSYHEVQQLQVFHQAKNQVQYVSALIIWSYDHMEMMIEMGTDEHKPSHHLYQQRHEYTL